MTWAYYPGCSLEGTAGEYDRNARALCRHLGIDLVELPDWSCCGARCAQATARDLAVALPARNLALAADAGLDRIVSPCPACAVRLYGAAAAPPARRDRAAAALGRTWPEPGAAARVASLLELLYTEVGPAGVRSRTVRPLAGLKLVCYYGCLLVRPVRPGAYDDHRNPMSMERLLQAAGAQPLPFAFKTECCGAGTAISHPDLGYRLIGGILAAARAAGAEAVVVACQLCQSNLDTRQRPALAAYADGGGGAGGGDGELPIVYLTQLLGLATGLDPAQLGLDRLFVDPRPLLGRKGLLTGRAAPPMGGK